jgi:hypothetical protein
VRGSESAQMSYDFGRGEDKGDGERGREVVGGGQATTASPRMRAHALSGTRGHEPSWAAGKQALPLKLLPKF